MGQWFSANIASLCVTCSALATLTLAANYTANSSLAQFACPEATIHDHCLLHCDEENKQNYVFDCGNSGWCTFVCGKKKCFESGKLDASNAMYDLRVLSSAQECLKSATVNVTNTGNATFEMTEQKSFQQLTVNDGANTQNIKINCTFGSGDECKLMTVNAEDTQYLEIIVGAASDLKGDKNGRAQINCPRNSSYTGPETAPCIIDLSEGGTLSTTDINTVHGIGTDVWIKTGPATTISDVEVTCNAGTTLNDGNAFPQFTACWTTTTAQPTTSTPSKPPTSITTSPTAMTSAPTTTSPTTATPTTTVPTTSAPTTTAPTTFIPSTSPIIAGTPTASPISSSPSTSPITASPTTKAPTTSAPTAVPTTAAFDACVDLCAVDGTPQNCQVNMDPIITIPCTDARNECAAKCIIEAGLIAAKANNPSYAPIIDAIDINDAFLDYCQSGSCIDYIPTSTPSLAPITAAPTTRKPTEAPLRPGDPSKAPTDPTKPPTNMPSMSPSKSPSKWPTTATPSNSPSVYNECSNQCGDDELPQKCEVNMEPIVFIPCTDARNECFAKCLIEATLNEAQITQPHYAAVISNINIDNAFIDYCETGTCLVEETTSTPYMGNASTLNTDFTPSTTDSYNRLKAESKSNPLALIALVMAFVSVLLLIAAFVIFVRKKYASPAIAGGKKENDDYYNTNGIAAADFSDDTPSEPEQNGAVGTGESQIEFINNAFLSDEEAVEMNRVKQYEQRKKKRRREEHLKKEKLEIWLEEMSQAQIIEKAKLDKKLQPLKIATCLSSVDGCCGCFGCIVIIMVAFGIYVLLFPICLSFNFSDFKVINSAISSNYYQRVLASETSYDSLGFELTLSSASNGRRRRRRLQSVVYGHILYSSMDYYYRAISADALTVFYYSKKTDNILTNELLAQVHEIETGIKQFGGYSNHSLIYEETNQNIKKLLSVNENKRLYLESPPGSFLNYVYPQILLGNYVFNGNGEKLMFQNDDIRETIASYEDLVGDFFDFSFNLVNVSSKYLAAVYPFGYSNGAESSSELFNWVASYKRKYFDKVSLRDIGVAVSDSRGLILQNELYLYLERDLNLAIASLVIIYIVLYLYCHSFYITTLGLFGVCLSFVPCLAIYQMLWAESFNLMNMVSIWVILGIGLDDIAVFLSSYRRAPLQLDDGTATPNSLRLAFAFREAGTAMFVTSLTTACSFFSLCFSTINPLPQFGWFLGSLVITNFIMVMTWFPCILQSYVYFVELGIKYDYHIKKCTKWLAVAITNYDGGEQGKAVADNSKQDSKLNLLKKTLINKLDKKHKHSYVDNNHSFFGDGTILYFIIMKSGVGLALIAVLSILTVIFAYNSTALSLAQETAQLLPENTNWGQLNIAISKMNIDENKYSGYSTSSGSTSSGVVVIGTPRPSKSPTTRKPTRITTKSPTPSPTYKPTYSPTLATTSPTNTPTKSPSTSPSYGVTTLMPSTSPTVPTVNPSANPSISPTQRPTYPVPMDDTSYRCINDGDMLTCDVDTFIDSDGEVTSLRQTKVAFVFEGGGLYHNDSIVNCPYSNNISVYYDKNAYISEHEPGYDVKWCFIQKSPKPVSSVKFEIEAPFSSLMTTDWYRISLWLYYNNKWNQILNKKNEAWYNYSIYGYEGSQNRNHNKSLNVEESVTIYLLFGTEKVTQFKTDCDGKVTSGELIFDSNFDIYSESAQKRWLQLCHQLNAINDNVMYRKDADQALCFAFAFNEYLRNSSYGPKANMPSNYSLNRQLFNKYLAQFTSQPTSLSFSDQMPSFDPRTLQSWFGTATNRKWSNNASIAWLQQSIHTQINKEWSGPRLYEYYLKWDGFVARFNAQSPAQFKCIQTSSSYIRMEVEVAFIDGFIKSVAYTMILCAFVMVFFTQNLCLVLLVCLYILIICIWVIGVFATFSWSFGIIEIISVPTIVGLAIDFALHITHAFIHSPFPDRLRRSQSAVNDLGSSVFAAAITTISAMFILYFATIIIFSDLGFVVASTTTFALFLALFICPSCLMYVGPQYDQCHIVWFLHLCCAKYENINGFTCGGHTFCGNRWHKKKKKSIDLNAMSANEIELEIKKQMELNNNASTNIIREMILSDTELMDEDENENEDENGNIDNEFEYFEDINVENELVEKIKEKEKLILIQLKSKSNDSHDTDVEIAIDENQEKENQSDNDESFEDEYYDDPINNDFVD